MVQHATGKKNYREKRKAPISSVSNHKVMIRVTYPVTNYCFQFVYSAICVIYTHTCIFKHIILLNTFKHTIHIAFII